MNDDEKINKVLQELEDDINSYHPLAWGIPFDGEAVKKMQELIDFYELRKSQWMRLLAGASETQRNYILEFMKCADLEIEGAESVLYMIQGKKKN